MSRIIRTTRFWLLSTIAVAAFAGTAYATILGGDGVIRGCYAKSGGTLRVIDASVTDCKAGETALSWSQQGQPGPKGDPGQPGGPGPQGEQGEPGVAGGLAGYEIVVAQTEFSGDDSKFQRANCPAGKLAVGGGAFLQGEFSGVALDHSEPRSDGLGWDAQAHEIVLRGDTSTWRLGVRVICANAA
jgi:hypothetical protein